MSLKVLLADDNITAQRLGSKILTDAGYEVIAVSNGAAAVKKIASDKPDLLILDVFMPGYTGLEVCEKVKNDPATAKTPVILTVTNMEPYNQQDGNRVHADGLMIKPFEATDLVAVIQKFAAKSAKKAQTDYDHTVKMSAVEEFKDASYEEWKAAEEPEPQKIEMPMEMASAPALGFDETPAEPAPATMEEHAPAASAFAVESAAPAFGVEESAAPAFGVEASGFGAEQPAAPSLALDDTPTASIEASPAMDWTPASSSAPSIDLSPALQGHAEVAAPAELEYTSAPAVDVHVAPAAELESTSVPSVEAVVAQDPALVTNPDELSQFATQMGVEHPEDIPVGIAMPGLTAEEPAAEPTEAAPAHEQYATTIKMQAYAEPEPAPAVEEPAAVEDEMQRAFAANASGAAAAPAPAAETQLEHEAAPPAPIPDELVAQFQAELDQAHQEREAQAQAAPATVEDSPLTESSMAVAAEIPASQMDEEKIAAAVNRALEKYKDGLRAELIATIVRELKG